MSPQKSSSSSPPGCIDTPASRESVPRIGKAINWRIVRRLFDCTKPYQSKRNLVLVLTGVRAVQKPAIAVLIATIINGPIAERDYPSTIRWTGALGLLMVSIVVVFHLRQRNQLELGEAVVHDLRNALQANLQRLPISFFAKNETGTLLSHVVTDMEAVRRGLQQVGFFSLLLIGQMLCAAAIMLYCDWMLFTMLLMVTPFIWLVGRKFHYRLKPLAHAAAENSGRIAGNLVESVEGIRVIQGFAQQAQRQAIFERYVHYQANSNVALASLTALHLSLLELSSQLFVGAVVIVCGYGVLHGFANIRLDSMIVFFFLPALFFQSLQQLGNLHSTIVTSMAGAERVFRLIDMTPASTESSSTSVLPDPRPRSGELRLGAYLGIGADVEFRNVTFGYLDERPAISHVSFHARKGEMVALVGAVGSGKTTIINLLAKFYQPSSGQIFVDGQEIRNIAETSLRQQLGIVHQHNFLFNGTVRANIIFGRPNSTGDEIERVIDTLNCRGFIERLPEGLNTQIGEGGVGLSLGERQLICLARALLTNPRILLFDEATSAIDPATESRLEQIIPQLLSGRTSFIVAHRLTTVVKADQILVLDGGHIVERGSHQQLLNKQGHYYALYRKYILERINNDF